MGSFSRKALLSGLLLGGALFGLLSHATDKTSPKPGRSVFAAGRDVYVRNCVICHGHRGDGKGEMAKDLLPQPRDFRSGIFKYRSTPSGLLPTDDDLARVIRGGLSDTAMPMFSHLSEKEIATVIEYIKSYSSRWRKAEHKVDPLVIPAEPKWLASASTRRAPAEIGRKLFQQACAACHGDDGAGKGTVTDLVDSWGNPAPPPDLRKPYIRIGRAPRDIYQILVTGINGSPMPSFLESTTEEARWAIVAYILELREKYAAHAAPASIPR